MLDSAAFPDCDGNGINDLVDLIEGTAVDLDGDFVPDSCPYIGDHLFRGSSGTVAIGRRSGAPHPCILYRRMVSVTESVAAAPNGAFVERTRHWKWTCCPTSTGRFGIENGKVARPREEKCRRPIAAMIRKTKCNCRRRLLSPTVGWNRSVP